MKGSFLPDGVKFSRLFNIGLAQQSAPPCHKARARLPLVNMHTHVTAASLPAVLQCRGMLSKLDPASANVKN